MPSTSFNGTTIMSPSGDFWTGTGVLRNDSSMWTPPVGPVTFPQRILLCFWLSCWVLCLAIKTGQVIRRRLHKGESGTRPCCSEPSSFTEPLLGDGNADLEPSHQMTSSSSDQDPLGCCSFQQRVLQGIFCETPRNHPSFEQFLLKATYLLTIMLFFWWCDYLRKVPSMDRQYSRDVFLCASLLLLIVAVMSSRTETKPILLNRSQTDEWRGWMQVQFVWYHYFKAEEVYNAVRCYIAAYVWMTGFGNFSYFYKTQDYSLLRVGKMLFRLNFIVCLVIVVSTVEWAFYYICAMHTYWFISVWAMMGIASKYNERRRFMVLKFIVYAIFNAVILEFKPVTDAIFSPLHFMLRLQGDLNYWVYRIRMDRWMTLIGMLFAYNFHHFERFLNYLDDDDKNLTSSTHTKRIVFKVAISLGLIGTVVLWYMTVYTLDKTTYLLAHPFTAWIPVIAYLWFRNCSSRLRGVYIALFAWLGKITLETYLSQIHVYLNHNAKRVIFFLPGYPCLNFIIGSAIHIAISHQLFQLTAFFNDYLLPKEPHVLARNAIVGIIWLGGCAFVAMLTSAIPFMDYLS